MRIPTRLCHLNLHLNGLIAGALSSALVLFSILLASCTIYSSADRKDFNANGVANAGHAAQLAPVKTLEQRTICDLTDNTSALLLRGVDILRTGEAWNIEIGDAPGSWRFVWARRSGNENAVVCITHPLQRYELENTLPHLPNLAAHLSGRFP